MRYLFNLAIAIDQMVNTLLGGDPDETLSSRCGKSRCRFCKWLCAVMERFDYRHCAESIEADEGGDATWRF
jgi:hypothetical protein